MDFGFFPVNPHVKIQFEINSQRTVFITLKRNKMETSTNQRLEKIARNINAMDIF